MGLWKTWKDYRAVSALQAQAARDPAAALSEARHGLQWGSPSATLRQAYIGVLEAGVKTDPQNALHAVREILQSRREADQGTRNTLISIITGAAGKQPFLATSEAGSLLTALPDLTIEQQASLIRVLAAGAEKAPAMALLHAGSVLQTLGAKLASGALISLVNTIKTASESPEAPSNYVVRAVGQAIRIVHDRDPELRAVLVGIMSGAVVRGASAADAASEAATLLLGTYAETQQQELLGVLRSGLNAADPAVRQGVAEQIVYRIQSDYKQYIAQDGWQITTRQGDSAVGIRQLAAAFREAVDKGNVQIAALPERTLKFLRSAQEVGPAFNTLASGLYLVPEGTRASAAPAPRPA